MTEEEYERRANAAGEQLLSWLIGGNAVAAAVSVNALVEGKVCDLESLKWAATLFGIGVTCAFFALFFKGVNHSLSGGPMLAISTTFGLLAAVASGLLFLLGGHALLQRVDYTHRICPISQPTPAALPEASPGSPLPPPVHQSRLVRHRIRELLRGSRRVGRLAKITGSAWTRYLRSSLWPQPHRFTRSGSARRANA